MGKNIDELFKEFPELEEIAMRLDDSEKAAEAANKKLSKKPSNDSSGGDTLPVVSGKSRIRQVYPEHATITDYYQNKAWYKTPYALKSGRKEFELGVLRVVDTRDPSAIVIQIYPSSRKQAHQKPLYEKTIWLKEDDKTDDAEKHSSIKVHDDNMLGEIKSQMEKLQLEFQEGMKKSPAAGGDIETQLKLMQLQQAQSLKELEHKYELEKLERNHKDEIRDLEREIEERDAEIEDLKLELAEVDANLNGIEEKIEAAKNPDWINVAGKVVSRGIEGFIKENVPLVSDSLGLDPKDIKEYFTKKDAEKKLEKKNDGDASFEKAEDSDPLSGIPEDNKKYATAFLKMAQGMSLDDLKKLFTLQDLALNENFTINEENFGAMLKAATENKV